MRRLDRHHHRDAEPHQVGPLDAETTRAWIAATLLEKERRYVPPADLSNAMVTGVMQRLMDSRIACIDGAAIPINAVMDGIQQFRTSIILLESE